MLKALDVEANPMAVGSQRAQVTDLQVVWDSRGSGVGLVSRAGSLSSYCTSKWNYQSLSCVRSFVTPRTVARQAPLSMGIL